MCNELQWMYMIAIIMQQSKVFFCVWIVPFYPGSVSNVSKKQILKRKIFVFNDFKFRLPQSIICHTMENTMFQISIFVKCWIINCCVAQRRKISTSNNVFCIWAKTHLKLRNISIGPNMTRVFCFFANAVFAHFVKSKPNCSPCEGIIYFSVINLSIN